MMRDGQRPLVSIITPAYNSAEYIHRPIESVLRQTYPNVEMIVVDDGSRDNTAEVVEQRYGGRVRCFRQANGGQATARNTGLRHARGEIIGFVDADDELMPEMVSSLVEALEAYSEAAVASGSHICETGGVTLRGCPRGAVLPGGAERGLVPDFFETYRRMEIAGMGSVLVRRKVFEEIGTFCDGMDSGSDTEYWIRIGGRYPWAFVDREMMIYHRSIETSRSMAPGRVPSADWIYDETEMQRRIRPELWDSFRRFRRDQTIRLCRVILSTGSASKAREALRRIPPAPMTRQWQLMRALARLPGPLTQAVIRFRFKVRALLGRGRGEP